MLRAGWRLSHFGEEVGQRSSIVSGNLFISTLTSISPGKPVKMELPFLLFGSLVLKPYHCLETAVSGDKELL